MVTSQQNAAFSGSSGQLLSMSVSGRGDSISLQDPHAAIDDSAQNRSLKDRGVV